MDSNCFGALFGGLCSNLPDCMAQAQVASMTVSREKAELRVGAADGLHCTESPAV